MIKKIYNILLLFFIIFFILFTFNSASIAAVNTVNENTNTELPFFPELNPETLNNQTDFTYPVQLAYFLTILAMAPALILMMTGFTRIVIILSFVKNAMGVQQAPPNIVVIGLSLFLTFFVMSPVIDEINKNAVEPYLNEEISWEQAIKSGEKPVKDFMFRQTRPKDLNLFLSIKGITTVENYEDIPMHVLVPAFAISELKSAFQVGFIIYIPFLIIDMVISSILMAMGMMMLPPVIISLPFKILLFILVDGWNLIVGSIIQGFR